jgi:hypothetical protein
LDNGHACSLKIETVVSIPELGHSADIVSCVLSHGTTRLGAVRFIGQYLGLSVDASKLMLHMKITDIETESVKIPVLAIPGLSQS